MKNKLLNSGFGIGNIVFIAAVILALPLRIYQYVAGILEPGTGFYAENSWSIYALYAVIIAAVAASVVIGIIKKKTLGFSSEATRNPLIGIFSALSAAGLVIDAFTHLTVLRTSQPSLYADTAPAGLPSHNILLIQIIVSLVTALFFVILTIGSFSGKTSGTEYRILSLTPVFWSIIRMVGRFMRTISYVRVSELLFEMVMLVFMIMFFMAFAQCNSKVNEKDCIWKVAAYGLPAALLALVCSVPRIILSLIGSADLIYSQSSVEFADLGIALFIIAVVLTKVITKTESDETEEEDASEESEEAEEKAETEGSTVITEE